jgi:hypothetical protein
MMQKITHLFKNKIGALEKCMLEMPQADIPVSHASNGGMYARTITIKAGTVLTGSIHLSAHLNIVHGDITIVTEEGERRYTGTHVIPSQPGTKRAGVAHADTVWTTILKTDETDVAKIEADFVTNNMDDPRLIAQRSIEMIGE